MHSKTIFAAGLAVSCLPVLTYAAVTGVAGSSQPHNTIQPSLGINYIVRTSEDSAYLGDIELFAGNFAPSGWSFANGLLLSPVDHINLFSLIGTQFGGDGLNTFALPDLRGRTAIGQGTGPGLPTYQMGEPVGSEAVTLSVANLSIHQHSISINNVPVSGTGIAGQSQRYNNMQPSLGLNYMINDTGIFPGRDTHFFEGPEPARGQIALTTRFIPRPGWELAQGQLIPISSDTALFSVIGTTYGGNGTTHFALPDFRGRAVIGVGSGPGRTQQVDGEVIGSPSASMFDVNLPEHSHSLSEGIVPTTDTYGLGLPINNLQPTLAMHYLISLDGIYPAHEGGDTGDVAFFGEIKLFAGNYAPAGWAFCDGQLLPIASNTALFSLLGTFYGGDGKITFALPDLRGLLAVDAGQGPGLSNWDIGEITGTETNSLTLAQMPAHTHTYTPVPEPASLGLLVAGALVLLKRRKEVSAF